MRLRTTQCSAWVGGSRREAPATGPSRIRGARLHPSPREREFFIDNLLVRIYFIIVMMRWTGLAPWEFEFPFPGSLTSTFLTQVRNYVAEIFSKPRTPNSKPHPLNSETLNREPQTLTPTPKLKSQNPKFRTQNPKHKTPKHKTQT